MKIRIAILKDRDAWGSIWKGYQDYYEVDLSETTENTWQRMMEPNDDGPFCLLCEDDTGELIRFTTYVFHPHTWQPEPRCYLIDLYSTPKICGKGIGLTLIAAVYEKVDKHDCCQVYWLKLDFNEAGRRLYNKVAKLTPFIKYQR